MFKKIQDTEEEIVRQLRRLNQNLSDTGGDTHIDIEEGGSGAAETDGTPVYMTTGEGGVTVDGEWDEIELGFAARTANLRFDQDLLVAFNEPYDRASRIIPLEASESPFTIGGDGANGIDTDEVWLKRAETAAEDPLVHLIAYR